jgi:hypothetical protein
VTGQLPFSPRCFLAAGEACELWPTEACLPQARTVESAEEISDGGAP